MIPLGCIHGDIVLASIEVNEDSGAAPRNWINNDARHQVQRNIIDTKAPHKPVDAEDMLLMWLGSKEGFKHPAAVANLRDVAKLFKGGNAFPHDWCFIRAVVDFLDSNRRRIASIDFALIIPHRDEKAVIIEYAPKFFD